MTSFSRIIGALQSEETREVALSLLTKIKGEDVAPVLWSSCGTTFILIQEVISAYGILSTLSMSDKQARRICSALILLQGMVNHPRTRQPTMNVHIPAYVLPLLDNTSREKCYEYVRGNALGVIAAVAKPIEEEGVMYLLEHEAVPKLLRCMDVGSVISKTVAVFTLHRIIQNDKGLHYCCKTPDRFFAIVDTLNGVLAELSTQQEPDNRLLKYVTFCYEKISQHPRACAALGVNYPSPFNHPNIARAFSRDAAMIRSLQTFDHNIMEGQTQLVPEDSKAKN
ncbi:uncharacterized protein [Rutidosis leptorrhynchoides]|uniref:uncharacterized protein n=1 Tax=Rutidosis leptorrhynchoides TaxID=125765 RepID=UPI003A9A47AE